MFRPRSPLSFVIAAFALGIAACVFLPWVEAGVFDGSDFVNGIDIPVIGWAVLVVGLIASASILVAAVHGSPWFWLLSNFVVVLLTTVLALALSLLDVVDSAVVKWILHALPEEARASTPTLAASFGLWTMFVMALIATGVTAAAAVGASRHRFREDEEVDLVTSNWAPPPLPPSTPGYPVYTPPELPWESRR